MKPKELLRLVWINITQNKFKVIMTSIGIIVGAATIVMVIAIGKGGQADVADQFKNLNAGAVDISYDGGTDFGGGGSSDDSDSGMAMMAPGGGSGGGFGGGYTNSHYQLAGGDVIVIVHRCVIGERTALIRRDGTVEFNEILGIGAEP